VWIQFHHQNLKVFPYFSQ